MEAKTILIIGDHEDGKLTPTVFELLTLALDLSGGDRSSVGIVLTGDDLDALAARTAESTGVDVLCLTNPSLSLYNCEAVTRVLNPVIREINPGFVLIAHTSQGLDYAPGLAVGLAAACITGVNGHGESAQGEALFTRAVCGGNFNAGICPTSPICVLTVQPGSFARTDKAQNPGRIFRKEVSVDLEFIQSLGLTQSKASASQLNDAKIIVSAGRGIEEEENLEVIRHFAARIPHSAVGGSRPLIDIGWLEYKYQVGITGTIVSPDVYIACGISGSSQHIAGMNTSKFVISINNDPNAAIFNVSDICIVDDVVTFIEAVEDLLDDE